LLVSKLKPPAEKCLLHSLIGLPRNGFVPPGHDARVRKITTFISRAMTFISLFPQGGGFIAVLEDLRTGRVVEIDKPDVVSKARRVTVRCAKRMRPRPARDASGTMVQASTGCARKPYAKVGLMAYSSARSSGSRTDTSSPHYDR
jgi:hypothetical protein